MRRDDTEASPSAGWQSVYAAMGVPRDVEPDAESDEAEP
jgi:hypothetical protein